MRKHPSMMLVLILVATTGLSACAEKKPEPLPPPPANLRTTQLRSLPQRLRLRPEVPHTSFPRHSATSLLLNSGVDPFAVQKLAGHSDVRLTTQTYAHVQTEALRRAAGVLDRVGPDSIRREGPVQNSGPSRIGGILSRCLGRLRFG